MALVKCKECGGQVSTSAKNCPSCGAPPPKKTKVLNLIIAAAALFAVLLSVVGGRDETPTTSAPPAPPAPPVGKSAPKEQNSLKDAGWSLASHKDGMTDEEVKLVTIQSDNRVHFEFPYNSRAGSSLEITFRRKGGELDAMLSVSKGQILCSSLECSFELRVGDGQVQRWTGVESASGSSELMFVRDVEKFEEIVSKGQPIRIGLQFYQTGTKVFSFDTKGYPGI